MVKRGVVNINTVASDTGMNFTQANAESIVRLPNNEIIISIMLSNFVFGHNLCPNICMIIIDFKRDLISLNSIFLSNLIFLEFQLPLPIRIPNIKKI